jgi:hypothetical protein
MDMKFTESVRFHILSLDKSETDGAVAVPSLSKVRVMMETGL